ncbi:Maf family protein [Psychrobacter sp. I-STPA6b]|uniref:Maf family protein n=1 Tax=Psychrobacter sp. I-STPA6b TaxID=2585718 RepID=UPI001D0C638E|nr:Maf family protein [Psychrobacter sp. I-STPA6b]
MLPIFLASSSPRRQSLLNMAGVSFSTLAVEIDESIYTNELPQDYIVRMVHQKMVHAVTQLCCADANVIKQPCLVMTADTIGVLPDGKTVLVKPKNKQDAFVMWEQMSDNTHEVWTAVCLSVITGCDNIKNIEQQNNESKYALESLANIAMEKRQQYPSNIVMKDLILEKTEVNFIALTEQMMQDYWQTGEPCDKAGGYAIQGRGAAWVKSINGSYTNVVGLPLAQVLQAIEKIQTHFI